MELQNFKVTDRSKNNKKEEKNVKKKNKKKNDDDDYKDKKKITKTDINRHKKIFQIFD